MRIGYVQLAPALGDLPATLTTIDRLLAGVEADLLVLPELCNSGYNFRSKREAWETSESIADSVFLRHLEAVCRERRMHVVTGFNERDGIDLYNSAVLIGPQGVIGRYRKLHLFLNEKDHFRPGDAGLPVFDIGLCRVGILVCFDWLFPEAWRVLALKGADVVCHPSNLVLPGLAQRGVPIHALVNRIYVVTGNRVGTEGDLTFTGRSLVADPLGDVLVEASAEGEEVGATEVDVALARNKKVTPRNDVLADRRPEEYAGLCGP
ncbi:MAG TPA: nitrilase-related carbon-nitrogen hydrolase [Anaerolineae bacterium]|nr:nitrilase-related carbon-nitrogen hydrolase [Anaerolineae bacterium]